MKEKQLFLFLLQLTFVFGVEELKLVHIIYTHKLYAPSKDILSGKGLPNNLTYEYFNSASSDLSNKAKLNLYDLGVHLRKTYDNFLGDVYTAEIMKVHTTEFPLSIMSAQLVNAGLWPSSDLQKWNDWNFTWQPIPFEFTSMKKDTLFLGTLCPNFRSEVENLLKSEEMQSVIEHYLPLFQYISNELGINVTLPSEVAFLYSTLETILDRDLPLPKWADGIYPDGEMFNATMLHYNLLSKSLLQQQLNGGSFMKEIIYNSLNYAAGIMSSERKLMLYSGDEINVAGILKTMNLWSPHIPMEGAALIFELYRDNDTDTYGMKVAYYIGVHDETVPLTLPRCKDICPIEVFTDIIFRYIPPIEESLCGWVASTSAEEQDSSDLSNTHSRGSTYASISVTFLIISRLIQYTIM